MAATDRPAPADDDALEFIVNETEKTVTVAPARPGGITLPATEWLTVPANAVVDPQKYR